MDVVIYDNACALCLFSVQLVLKHDAKKRYSFTPLDGTTAGQFFAQHKIVAREMIWLVRPDGSYYYKSGASLRIIGSLGGIWFLAYGLLIIPYPIRDFVYDMISKRRRQLLRNNVCPVIGAEYNDRFLP